MHRTEEARCFLCGRASNLLVVATPCSNECYCMRVGKCKECSADTTGDIIVLGNGTESEIFEKLGRKTAIVRYSRRIFAFSTVWCFNPSNPYRLACRDQPAGRCTIKWELVYICKACMMLISCEDHSSVHTLDDIIN